MPLLLPPRLERLGASWLADAPFAGDEIGLPRLPLSLGIVAGVRGRRVRLRVVGKRFAVRMLVLAFPVLIDVVLRVLSAHEERRRKARAEIGAGHDTLRTT